jgi:hypothetical protein
MRREARGKMAKVLTFPTSHHPLPDGAARQTSPERQHGDQMAPPSDQPTQARSELQREIRATILLLDLTVFRLREAALAAGTSIPQSLLTRQLETIDTLLNAARISAGKI